MVDDRSVDARLDPLDLGAEHGRGRTDGLLVLDAHGTEHRVVERDLARVLPHAHQVDEHLPGRDGRAVHELLQRDLLDRLRHAGERRRQALEHEARVFARRMEASARPRARRFDPRGDVFVVRGEMVVRRGRDDALPRLEQRDDVVGVRVRGVALAGCVQHHVGIHRQDRLASPGSSMTSCNCAAPTAPVAHWMTRIVICGSLA